MYDGEELIVHRKGATPAGKGKLGVVPGSMGSPGFIVRGKGNAESFNSCSHGAGRVMSRAAAFRTLKHADMKKILKEQGISLIGGTLDESPEVYKDINKVIDGQRDLVDVLAKFEPKLVRMAAEGNQWGNKKEEKSRRTKVMEMFVCREGICSIRLKTDRQKQQEAAGLPLVESDQSKTRSASANGGKWR